MDFLMAHAPRDYPLAGGSEPVPLFSVGNNHSIKREIASRHPARDYEYLGDWMLVKCTRAAKQVTVVSLLMANLVKKAQLKIESQLSICQCLLDTYVLGNVLWDSKLTTTLHDMMGDLAVARFPHKIEVRHLASISRDLRYMFKVSHCLRCFKKILKKEGIYEAI